MSKIYIRNDVPRGYLNPEEVEKYVNRIRCAAKFGDTAPCEKDECLTDVERRAEQKKMEVRYEVEKIYNEWRARIRIDCSYRHFSEEYWDHSVKDRIRDNARDIIRGISATKLDEHDGRLDSELKWICMTWLEDLHTTIEYCPNNVCITPKDIYNSLWKCRDFELKHLWQRSIFLTTFLVTCFTGYGAVFLKLCKCMGSCVTSCRVLIMLNCVGMLIAFVGCVLSVLWIMMGKGSKAWYEQYEQSIVEIETNPKYSGVVPDMWNDRVMHGHLTFPPTVNDNLFKTEGGRYSVSKINISLGQVALIVWGIIYIGQSCLFAFTRPMVKPLGQYDVYGISISLLILFIFLGIVSGMLLSIYLNRCKSSTVKADENEVIKEEKDKLRKELRKEGNNPRTLIIIGDEFGQSSSRSCFYFPTDSKYIFLNCNEQIGDGIYDRNILSINQLVDGNGTAEDIIDRHRSFFDNLSDTNMIIVYDSSFDENYWPYLIEIVRMTGKKIFWMILCHTDVDTSNSPVQGQRQRFIELAGLENYDIVIDPENVFNPKDTKKTDGCGAVPAKTTEA